MLDCKADLLIGLWGILCRKCWVLVISARGGEANGENLRFWNKDKWLILFTKLIYDVWNKRKNGQLILMGLLAKLWNIHICHIYGGTTGHWPQQGRCPKLVTDISYLHYHFLWVKWVTIQNFIKIGWKIKKLHHCSLCSAGAEG